MTDELPALRSQVSGNHRRVISVRMRLLEESCLRLLDLFRPLETTLTSRRALPQEKEEEVERMALELRSKISQVKSELGLERAHQDGEREARAVVAAMTTDIEELHPDYLKGYGQVPDGLALYLEIRINELLGLMRKIGQALSKKGPGGGPRVDHAAD